MKPLVALMLVCCAATAGAQGEERVAEIRIHGNYSTPDADIRAMSGLEVGVPATPARLAEAEGRLRDSKRFESVEVRRRFVSIEDPSAILVMIVVDERPGATAATPLPGVLRRLGLSTMWMPILNYADGYGFTYGVRFAFVDPLGPDTRISVPLSWGGERRGAFEVERTFEQGPFTRIAGSTSAYRRVNPHYDIPDARLEARGTVERTITRSVRVRAAARAAVVDFGGIETRHTGAGGDVICDTRLDPSFPRNAVHTIVGWEHLTFEGGGASVARADVRGYVGVFRSSVVALRAQLSRASSLLPPSEQPLLGGTASLRGYRAGHQANDNMAAVSAELRVPLSSPLSFGRLGVKGFIDAGTTWSVDQRLSSRPFDHGIGGGVYAGVAAFMINVDVAWPEEGKPRVNVGMGVTF